MMYFLNKQNQYRQGFTLVETLVAISVLLLVLVGPLTITARTGKSAAFATEQIVAQFLAQEGVELVQKARDDLLLTATFLGGTNVDPWADFLRTSGNPARFANCYSVNGCGLEMLTNGNIIATPLACTALLTTSPCRLFFDARTSTVVRSRYTHTATGNTNTGYHRAIYLTPFSGGVWVRSVVTWTSGGILATQSLVVESAVMNTYNVN